MLYGLSKIDRKSPYIRAVIDYGSKMLKIAGQLHDERYRPSNDVHLVFKETNDIQLEQEYVIDDDKEKYPQDLIQGETAVQHYLKINPQEAKSAVSHLKLCLLPEYADSPAVRQVYEALGLPPKEDLQAIKHELKVLFEAYRARTIDHVRVPMQGRMRQVADDIPIEAVITVPAALDEHRRGIYIDAAIEAGFRNLRLQPEPLCAAFAEMQALLDPGLIKDGDCFLFGDGGDSTFDVQKLIYENGTITPFGDATGAAAGGHNVEDAADEWLISECQEIRDQGGIDIVAQKLDIPLSMLRRQFARHICRIKHEPFISDRYIAIHGGQNAYMRVLHIYVPEVTFLQFMNRWAEKIFKCLLYHQRMCIKPVNVLILSGGASKSQHVRKYLSEERRLRELNVSNLHVSRTLNPVAAGGLARFPVNEAAEYPVGVWWLIRSERWNQFWHPKDKGTIWTAIYEDNGKGGRKLQAFPDPRFTREDKNSPGVYEATDRISRLMTTSLDHQPFCRRIAAEFEAPADQPYRLQIRLSYTKSDNGLADHCPLRDSKGNIRGVHTEWPIKEIEFPDLSTYDFVAESRDDGPLHYRGLYITEMNASNENITLKVKVLQHDRTFRWKRVKCSGAAAKEGDEDSDWKWEADADQDYPLAFEREIELWDIYRSHQIESQSQPKFSRPPKRKLAQQDLDTPVRRSARTPRPSSRLTGASVVPSTASHAESTLTYFAQPTSSRQIDYGTSQSNASSATPGPIDNGTSYGSGIASTATTDTPTSVAPFSQFRNTHRVNGDASSSGAGHMSSASFSAQPSAESFEPDEDDEEVIPNFMRKLLDTSEGSDQQRERALQPREGALQRLHKRRSGIEASKRTPHAPSRSVAVRNVYDLL